MGRIYIGGNFSEICWLPPIVHLRVKNSKIKLCK